jgi:hypothetical protein
MPIPDGPPRAQAVHEPGDVPIAFEILQAVVELPTAAAAQKLLADQTTQWAACSGTDFTLTYPNSAPQAWKFGPLTKTATVISMPQRWNGPAHMPQTGGCQRALAVRNNVVADVWACRLEINNQAVDLANTILARLPRQSPRATDRQVSRFVPVWQNTNRIHQRRARWRRRPPRPGDRARQHHRGLEINWRTNRHRTVPPKPRYDPISLASSDLRLECTYQFQRENL